MFWQKWLYSSKVVVFRQFHKVIVFGNKLLYSGKVVLFGQKWLYSGKVIVFG